MINYRAQKSALTRAVKSGDTDRMIATARKAVKEWDQHGWPDSWSDWQRALEDAGVPWHVAESIFNDNDW